MHTLLEPWTHVFMQHALAAVVLIGVTCATLGAYVVLRQMAFAGDALAHTAMPGLAVAYLYQWNLFLGALGADLLAALGIAFFARRRDVREDTAIGILFTGMFALGIVMVSKSIRFSFRDVSHMLLGNVLGVTNTDLLLMAGVALIVVTTLTLLHKELELSSFDAGYAEVIGLKTALLRLVLLFLLALTVVSAIQAVGVVLTSAMLVTPAATASLVIRRLKSMMALASGIAVVAGVVGLYVSWFWTIPSGAAIVLVCTAFFGAVYVGRNLARQLTAADRTPAPDALGNSPSANPVNPPSTGGPR
jgi:ABC-type Mn2+/Zn2+ transport system permease subunit